MSPKMIDLLGRAFGLAMTLWFFGVLAAILYPVFIDRPLRAFLRSLKS